MAKPKREELTNRADEGFAKKRSRCVVFYETSLQKIVISFEVLVRVYARVLTGLVWLVK